MKPGYYACETDEDASAVQHLYEEVSEQAPNYLDSSSYLGSSSEQGANYQDASVGQASYIDSSGGSNYLQSSDSKSNYAELDAQKGAYEDSDVSASGNYDGEGLESASGNYLDPSASGGNYADLNANYEGGKQSVAVKQKPDQAASVPPKKQPAPVDPGRDWHAEFLALLDRKVSSPLERLQRYVALQVCCF